MSWFFVLTIIFSNRFYNAQNSSSSSSSSAMSSSSSSGMSSSSAMSSSSSSAMSSSSSAMSSSSSAMSSSSSAMSSSSVMSSSTAMSSSSVVKSCMDYSSCNECFVNNCTWDFHLSGGCINSTETMLPYPLETDKATIDYCDITWQNCFNEFQNGMVHYMAVQDTWDVDNKQAMTKFSNCLDPEADIINCNGTVWNDANYSAMCISNTTIKAEVCSYTNVYTWPHNSSRPMHRLLLSSSSSSSPMSSSSSSSPMSSSSSSSPMSSSSSSSPMSSSSAMSSSSSAMSSSSSAMSSSSSAMSSSAMSSSSSAMSSNTVYFTQNYCFPSKCTAAFSKTPRMFDIIFTKETNFHLPSNVDASKAAVDCAAAGGGGSKLSTGAIVGIVVGVIIGLLLLGFLGFNMCRNKDDSGFQAM